MNLIVKKITGLFRFQIIKKIEEEERDPIGKTIEIKAAEATTKSYQVVNLLILVSHFLKKLKNLTRDQVWKSHCFYACFSWFILWGMKCKRLHSRKHRGLQTVNEEYLGVYHYIWKRTVNMKYSCFSYSEKLALWFYLNSEPSRGALKKETEEKIKTIV